MSSSASLKAQKRQIIANYVKPDNFKASVQVLTTLLPLAALWYGIAFSASLGSVLSYWLIGLLMLVMMLMLLRVFVLMHECGHGSLFKNAGLNRVFGFVFGVVCGMPQFVWSQHHQFHHANNGNWDRYRGPLAIITTDEYAAMSPDQQRKYRKARSIWIAPLAGFFYLLVNPRRNFLRGCVAFVKHVLGRRKEFPSLKACAEAFTTPFWATAQEFRHILGNNVAMLGFWLLMAWLIGPWLFLGCAIVSMSVAGGIGIVLFTVQHNYEHAYASGDEGWDYDEAALEGTSFLVLPRWLNWFTANIAYHHVHHMSARIPNYCLAACHRHHEQLFAGVRRVSLVEVPQALKCILWDRQRRCITSVEEFERHGALSPA